MRRRVVLGAAAGGLTTLAAGCVVRAPAEEAASTGATGDADLAADESATAAGGPPAPGEPADVVAQGDPTDVCERPIQPDSGIQAIVDPAFGADWQAHEVPLQYQFYRRGPRLFDDQPVVGVTWDGGARAYPLSVLLYHEVVNDTAGAPLVVTYCPLCASGMVASRRVAGSVTHFAVSGHRWRPEAIRARASEAEGRVFGVSYAGEAERVRPHRNLVLYDGATRSYWSQILASGICGPHAGTTLDIRPSTLASWGDWRREHPATDVLLPPPASGMVEPGVVLSEG